VLFSIVFINRLMVHISLYQSPATFTKGLRCDLVGIHERFDGHLHLLCKRRNRCGEYLTLDKNDRTQHDVIKSVKVHDRDLTSV
jgi:hypothetical protein